MNKYWKSEFFIHLSHFGNENLESNLEILFCRILVLFVPGAVSMGTLRGWSHWIKLEEFLLCRQFQHFWRIGYFIVRVSVSALFPSGRAFPFYRFYSVSASVSCSKMLGG